MSRRSCLSRWVALVAFLAGVVPASGHVLIDRALDNPLAPSVARFGELVVVDALELVPDPQPPNRFFLAVAWCAHDLLEPGRQAPKNLVHGTTSASFQNPGKSFPEKRFRVFPRGACTNVTLRARWYDPRNGIFLSEDPMGDVDSPNLYAFVGWSPAMGTDPLGLKEGDWYDPRTYMAPLISFLNGETAPRSPVFVGTKAETNPGLVRTFEESGYAPTTSIDEHARATTEFVSHELFRNHPLVQANAGVALRAGTTAIGFQNIATTGSLNAGESYIRENFAGDTLGLILLNFLDPDSEARLQRSAPTAAFAYQQSNWLNVLFFLSEAKPPRLVRPVLPAFTGETEGLLITLEGARVPLTSGGADPAYVNYISASHVEGKAALWIRGNGSAGGVVFHNNPGGTCGFCDRSVHVLLPEGAILWVVPPEGAVAVKPLAMAEPSVYLGDSQVPKLPPR